MIPLTFSQVYEGIVSITRISKVRVIDIFSPNSLDEDRRRREFILHIILAISISLLLILESTVIRNYLEFDSQAYNGVPPFEFGSLIIIHIVLFALSKKGKSNIASCILIGLYSIGTIYSGWNWGISLPATLLSAVLVILTSSVLIGSVFGFLMCGTMVIMLCILGIHEKIFLGELPWHTTMLSTTDIISYSAMLLFMGFIAWLSNREIDHSLSRARESEKLLGIERDTLEQRIAIRTQELIRAQSRHIHELEQAAQFGKLSQGLLHDLMNPLASISIHIKKIEVEDTQTKENLETVQKLITISQRMNLFMQSIRRFIDNGCSNRVEETIDLAGEINIIRDILSYKARMAGVTLIFEHPEHIAINANQIRIHQVLLNLILNAIESFEANLRPDRSIQTVITRVDIKEKHLILSISDNGCGIPSEFLDLLFKKPFTTKKTGTGNGLITVAQIVENELGGKITVQSNADSGTTFLVLIPTTSPSLPSPHDSLGTTASAMTSDTAEHP